MQLFTDMSAIERLAGRPVHEQERRVEDPTLRAIFSTFVKDEVRHAQVAQMLADFYDVHHYRVYQQSPHLARFTPAFVDAVRYLGDDVANAYITVGELILDIALLRSINDYVHDAMSDQAMRLINRDESRHIAIDYHMADYYTSAEYARELAARPSQSVEEQSARGEGAWPDALLRPALLPRGVLRADGPRGPDRQADPRGVQARADGLCEAGHRAATVRRVHAGPAERIQEPARPRAARGALTRLAGMEPRFMEQIPTEREELRAGRA